MPAKWNFLQCFLFLILLKNNSSEVKNETQNILVKWDTQSSEELVLNSYFFCYFKKRNHCIALENPNFENGTFKR